MTVNNDSSTTSSYDPNKKIDTELENDIIRYLMEKILSNDFDIKDLSYDALVNVFKMDSEPNNKRLQRVLKKLDGDKLSKKKSGIDIYIPNEVKNHPNLKNIKPISFNVFTISYIIGFALLIFILQVPLLGSYIGNFLIGFYSQSITPLIALSAAIGFFLPLSIGYAIWKAYLYVSPYKLITYLIVSIGLLNLIYILLIYGLNLFYRTTNYKIDPIGVLTAIAAGIAIVALPHLPNLFKKNGKNKGV